MKRFLKNLSATLLITCLAFGIFSGCGASQKEAPETVETIHTEVAQETEPQVQETKDYASMVKLNLASETAKQEVTVKTFVDGDTTHFNVPDSIDPDGVLRARYLAINTPESTGKIE